MCRVKNRPIVRDVAMCHSTLSRPLGYNSHQNLLHAAGCRDPILTGGTSVRTLYFTASPRSWGGEGVFILRIKRGGERQRGKKCDMFLLEI